MQAALSAHPANFYSGKPELDSKDERLIVQVGETLGADYVYALKGASGIFARVKLYISGCRESCFVLLPVNRVGVNDYYVDNGANPVSYPLTNKQRDELYHEVAVAMAKDIPGEMKVHWRAVDRNNGDPVLQRTRRRGEGSITPLQNSKRTSREALKALPPVYQVNSLPDPPPRWLMVKVKGMNPTGSKAAARRMV
jgi:hypothetical protein